MDLALGVKVLETCEELATYDGNVSFVEYGRFGFELYGFVCQLTRSLLAGGLSGRVLFFFTKSRHDPPPRYSITIQSLLPRRKLALYWVTWELAQVLRTEISAWMSWISSSVDSRSIYPKGACQPWWSSPSR